MGRHGSETVLESGKKEHEAVSYRHPIDQEGKMWW